MTTLSSYPEFTGSFKRTAWITVAVLWMVALLNYLDRNVMSTMHDSIVASIPMTELEFGKLNTYFLWIYGICSPLGGFIADKVGKKWIIFASLIVWSSVTWLTGHAQTLNQLLVARALMGISEACYIPAALALITDYHRGSTRSTATGLHNSGIYAGAALGGFGGLLADHLGWRMTFTIFGLIGVAYAFVVAFCLRDLKVDSSRAKDPANQVAIWTTLKSLFTVKAFLILLVLNIFVSISNWLIYSWMPIYLREHFSRSQGEAGLWATVPLQIASFVAILVGGAWADRWSRTNPRGRTYITAIGFAAAAPALFLTGSTSVLSLAVVGLIFYGFGRGFYDANLMPILRQTINERYSATGYGFLNFIGCMAGGVMILEGGALRDLHVPFGKIYQVAATGLAIMAVMLFFLKQRSRVSVEKSTIPVEE